jgi:hypothetical protein
MPPRRQRFLLAKPVDRAVLDLLLDLAEPIDAVLHRAEVGERASEPTAG